MAVTRCFDLYTPWRTHDGITHLAWDDLGAMYVGYYMKCSPYIRRTYAEGQGIGDAVITCVRCIAAIIQHDVQVHLLRSA